MSDDLDVFGTPDAPAENTVLTLAVLLGPTPIDFVFGGVSYHCQDQTTWHNDEDVTLYYEIRDEDVEYTCSYDKQLNGDAPMFGEVLRDILVENEELLVAAADETLIADAWMQRCAQVVGEKTAAANAAKEAFAEAVSEYHTLSADAGLTPPSGNLSTTLLSIFQSTDDAHESP